MHNLATGFGSASVLLLVLALPGGSASANEIDSAPFWLAQAEGYAAEIQVPDGRAALLVSIGSGYVELGANEMAVDLLTRALVYGKRCTGCFGKARRLAELGLLLQQAGDPMAAARAFDAAREAAADLEDPLDRIGARCLIAARMADTGDLMPARILCAETQGLADDLTGPARVQACGYLVEAWLAVGEVSRAEAAFAVMRSTRVLESDQDEHFLLDAALLALAEQALQGGDRHKARNWARLITDPETRVDVLLSLVPVEARARPRPQSLREAFDLAKSFEEPGARTRALLAVARAANGVESEEVEQAAVRLAARALEAAAATGGVARTLDLQLDWALAARRAGNEAGARGALRSAHAMLAMPEAGAVGEQALRRIAAALASGGEFLEAERAVRGILDPFVKIQARLDLADAYRRSGRVHQAYVTASHVGRLVHRHPNPSREAACAESLRRVAVLQAACGHFEEALLTVNAIDRPFQAATACTYIARDLTEGAERD